MTGDIRLLFHRLIFIIKFNEVLRFHCPTKYYIVSVKIQGTKMALLAKLIIFLAMWHNYYII